MTYDVLLGFLLFCIVGMIYVPKEGQCEAVTGTLGGGKTAYGVEMIYEILCRGGWVFTNIDISFEAVRERMASQGLVFDPARLVFLQGESMAGFHSQIKRGSPGEVVLVVIDEAHFDFDSRDRMKGDNETYHFVTLCRHLHVWLIFITQDGNDLEIKLRRRFAVETVCRNLKDHRIAGIPFPFPFFVRARYKMERGRATYKLGNPEWFTRSPAWGLYDTHALLGAKAQVFAGLGQAHRQQLKRIEKPGKKQEIIAAIAAFIVTLLCVF